MKVIRRLICMVIRHRIQVIPFGCEVKRSRLRAQGEAETSTWVHRCLRCGVVKWRLYK